MRIANTSDMQLEVPIVGPHADKDTVLLQPKGKADLPTGFVPQDPTQRSLYIFQDQTEVPPVKAKPAPAQSVASDKT